jgi:nucleoredoxin
MSSISALAPLLLLLSLLSLLTTPSTSQDMGTALQTTSDNAEYANHPLVKQLGDTLHILEFLPNEQEDSTQQNAQLLEVPTPLILQSSDVVGLYFSAEWCNPCAQFTPQLIDFYEKVNFKTTKHNAGILTQISGLSPSADEGENAKVLKKADALAKKLKIKPLEIIFIPRSREFDGYVQYFSTMPFVSLPFDDAVGSIGKTLSETYNIKSIPSLIFVDSKTGKIITKNGREEVSKDKTGRHFPYRSPLSKVGAIVTLPIKALKGVFRGVGGIVGLIKRIVSNIIRGALGMKVI